MDTGLCAYLSNWNTPETLESGAMGGAFFETFVKAFDTFADIEKTGYGSLICLTDHPRPITPNASAISVWDM
jgi:hypothetical protein